MFGLSILDLVVVFTYFLIALVLGYIAMKRVKDQEDFFLGGRGFGKFLSIFAAFGQATSSDSAVGTVTTTYRDGASGIWSNLGQLWTTPIYWLTAPWYRRMRVYSLGEFFYQRYGSRRMAILYAGMASLFLALTLATSLKALAVTMQGIALKPVSQLTVAEKAERDRALRLELLDLQFMQASLTPEGTREREALRRENPRREFSSISQGALVWTVIAVVFVYGLAGGLRGAVWTDVFQGILIFALSFLLLPFAWVRLMQYHGSGSMANTAEVLHADLPERFFSLLGSAANEQFTWHFILALCVMGAVNVAVQANQLTSNAAAKNEYTASFGFMTGILLKRYLTVVWGLLGILCFALYGSLIDDPDLVWGHATRDLLGSVGFGLLGLMVACLLAALQSTASALMIAASTLLTRDVYLPLRPGRSESHYVLVGRVCGALFLLVSGGICLQFDSMLSLMKYLWEFNAVLAASFWCGVKWRGANRSGAWASIGISLVLFTLAPAVLPTVFPGLRESAMTHAETKPRILNVEGEEVAEAQLGNTIVRPRAVFWSSGLSEEGNRLIGHGVFYCDLFLLSRVVDLEANSFALNETIRYWIRILMPFAILIMVSRWRAEPGSAELPEFVLRMRTQVRDDPVEDKAALAFARSHPESTESVLLFPNTRLEFQKFERSDYFGVGAGCAFVALLLVGLSWVLGWGG